MNANCCDVRSHITEDLDDCTSKKGGIEEIKIVCLKHLTFVEDDCDAGAGDDAKITDIETQDADNAFVATPLFYNVAVKDKANEYKWTVAYDSASGGLKNGEEMNLVIEVKSRAVYCILQKWAGQEVAVLFKERGTNRWYLAGRDGGLRVANLAGGTGTDTFTPTTMQLIGEDVDSIFLQVFDTDDAITEALVASQTAA